MPRESRKEGGSDFLIKPMTKKQNKITKNSPNSSKETRFFLHKFTSEKAQVIEAL